MKRYKYSKLQNLGPVHGFIIHTPDDRELKDTHPQTIVRELNRMADRIKRMETVSVEQRMMIVASGINPAWKRYIQEQEAKL